MTEHTPRVPLSFILIDYQSLSCLDRVRDYDPVMQFYRVEDVSLVVQMTPDNQIVLYSLDGSLMVGPTERLNAFMHGKHKNAESCREICNWLRTELKRGAN